MCLHARPRTAGRGIDAFEIDTGRPIDEIWARWLQLDPVRMAEAHADALGSMRRIYLDAGRQDPFFLDLGAQAYANELTRLGIKHSIELFDGTHSDTAHRYSAAIREPVLALDKR
jgi:hypothetical protein